VTSSWSLFIQGLGIFIRLDGKIRSENRNKYSCVEGFTDTLIKEKGKGKAIPLQPWTGPGVPGG